MERMKAYAKWTDQAIENMQSGRELRIQTLIGYAESTCTSLKPLYEKEPSENYALASGKEIWPEAMDSSTKSAALKVIIRTLWRPT